MTKILVTGGTGFIGSALAKRLVSDGYDVRVFDNNSRGVADRLNDIIDKIELIEGSVCDAEKVNEVTEGCDIVFHLAAVNGTENFYTEPERVLEVGVKGTVNTIDAAIAHKVKRYIFASSSEAYQQPTHIPTTEVERLIVPDVTNPRFSYGGSKITGELLTLHSLPKHSVEGIVFRPHNVYGPGGDTQHVIPEFVERIQKLSGESDERPLPFPIKGDGMQTRSFSYIDDTVEALMLILEKGKPNEIYNIGDEDEVTIKELAEKIGKVMGVELEVVPGELPSGETSRRCPDISKLRKLGYGRKVGLEEGLKKTIL